MVVVEETVNEGLDVREEPNGDMTLLVTRAKKAEIVRRARKFGMGRRPLEFIVNLMSSYVESRKEVPAA